MGVGPCAQAMNPHALVHLDGLRAEQRGQFTGRAAPHQVHLEVALLSVDTAERTHGVGLAARGNGDHAQRVALDSDCCA